MAKKAKSVYQQLKALAAQNLKLDRQRRKEIQKIDKKIDRKQEDNLVKAINLKNSAGKSGVKAYERLVKKNPRYFN
jgi:hypothetical protein